MRVKTFPEIFASYKVYDIVKDELNKTMREVDANKVIKSVISTEAKPEDFLKKMALILRKHVHATKASKIIMNIKERLKGSINYKIEPERIELSKKGKQLLKIYIENKTDATLKLKVGLQQVDRKYTALIFDPVKNFGYTKLVKSKIVDSGKMGVFKFLIKPDVYGIQDLYELRNKKELKITLGMQAEAEGIDGLKTSVERIPVKIVKVKI